MTYAKRTDVPVARTKGEIEETVKNRYGATAFGIMEASGIAQIAFRMNERNILFKLTVPDDPQMERSIWRAMLLTIKGKLESAERGIETFEEAFLANIVMPTGLTVAEHTIPTIEDNYRDGGNIPLLPDMRAGKP